MALSIEALWRDPIELTDGSKHNRIYHCDGISSIPNTPGVYVFARKHGQKVSPIYIGQTETLRARIESQFKSVPLMMGIKKEPSGQRILLYCEVKFKRGQDRKKVLTVLENALIDHALAEGCSLLNKQGTVRPAHVIEFSGNRTSEAVVPRKMMAKSAPTRPKKR